MVAEVSLMNEEMGNRLGDKRRDSTAGAAWAPLFYPPR